MTVEMSVLEAWAKQGWIDRELQHTHTCTECRVEVKCHCPDHEARWTTCQDCMERAA